MPAISSTLPAPMRVAGSGRERLCMTSAAMRAPAPETNLRNSANDSSASRAEASGEDSDGKGRPDGPSMNSGRTWARTRCPSSSADRLSTRFSETSAGSDPTAARRAEDTALRAVTPAGPARSTPTRTAVSSPWPEPGPRGCSETDRDCRLRAIVAPRPRQSQTERQQAPVQFPSAQPPDDAPCASRSGCLPRWKWRA